MLTWCSSAGNICRADWLGCLFDSSSISYPLHVKGDHQWFILYTAASCNVNAFIKKKDSYILTLWLSDKTVNQPRFCFCLEPPMIVWLEHFLFSFSAWHIQITVIKSQHGVSVGPPPTWSPLDYRTWRGRKIWVRAGEDKERGGVAGNRCVIN